MSNIRIRTTPGDNSFLSVNLNQKFDFIEILSLTLRQEDVYRNFCSDYGVVIGRVSVNNGFGVPNAKVSIFIPVDDLDKEDSEIFGLYPYEQVTDKNADGLRYNLLPKNNESKDDCYTPIGSFPNKREVLDSDSALYVYCKYYKFTTTTNKSGDYMFFGVPVGDYQVHVDVDMSDIGLITQKPYDFIREGSNGKLFETPGKFKPGTNLDTLTQLKSRTPVSVNVQPFWGDVDQCQVGITRLDIDLATNIKPHALFIGSIISDSEKNSINKNCRPRKRVGNLEDMATGGGRVEMIRKNKSGETERFDVLGGEVIDDDGVWAYQVPMNLDYVITDEFGNLIPTDDESKGLPTRARVRFRIKMNITGGEGRLRTRASYLVPHNPANVSDSDYTFDERTKDISFTDLYWNKIYTVSNHITRIQKNCTSTTACSKNRNFLGIKNVDDGPNTPFPFNKLTTSGSALFPLFVILCIVMTLFATIVFAINKVISAINSIINILNSVLDFFGVNPINCIKYILLDCNDEKYCVGCSSSNCGYPATEDPKILDADNKKWIDCITTVLADALGLLKFDFYNDWVNGTLYAYLLKYKIKRRGKGKERFCDYDCEDDQNGVDNNEDGQEDNKCKTISIVDTCTQASPQNNSNVSASDDYANTLKDLEINEGLIKKDVEGNELYYAAISKNNIRLYSTNIVSLGAVFDCDWQGVPKFYNYLVDTTFNIPPLAAEYYESNDPFYPDQIETSGYDTPGNNSGSLIAKITCLNISTNSNNCNNIRRLCELGVGLDEDRRDPVNGTGTPVDNKITNADVENPWIRGVFTYANYPTPLNNVPLVFIDNGGTMNYQDQYYKIFRGYDYLIPNNPPLWFYKNSYYFYFGLNQGKSALQKMLSNYFPDCIKPKKNDLEIIIDNVIDDNITGVGTGQISFHIEGGIGPFTYQWLGPTYNGVQFQCPDPNGTLTQSDCGNSDGSDFILQNLLGGQYTLVVTDSSGQQTSTTVNLTGINAVQCQTTPSPTNPSGDGRIIININGGVSPYTVTIAGITDTQFNETITTTLQTYCYGNCPAPNIPVASNTLPAGEYLVTVVDSGIQATIGGQPTIITTQCSDSVLIAQPSNVDILPNYSDAPCYDSFGSGEISVVGGVAPYDISWLLTSTSNPAYQPLVGTVISTNIQTNELPSGTYTINVIDLAGNTESTSIIINEPPQITLNVQSLEAPGCIFSSSGRINLNINGNLPPYTIEIDGDISQVINNQPNGLLTIDNLNASAYTITVTDSNSCQNTINVTVPAPQYGELYVRGLSKTYTIGSTNVSRIIIRFTGGHGGPYHFRLPNGNWINLGNPYAQTLPVSDYTVLNPNYTLYQSTTSINNQPTFEFQFWVTDTPGAPQLYPFDFDYYLTDGGQQNTYAMFRGNITLFNNGTNGGSEDSFYGTTAPYGCYSYRNDAGNPVIGNTPQGTLITQPT
jgi:hypothetical protein